MNLAHRVLALEEQVHELQSAFRTLNLRVEGPGRVCFRERPRCRFFCCEPVPNLSGYPRFNPEPRQPSSTYPGKEIVPLVFVLVRVACAAGRIRTYSYFSLLSPHATWSRFVIELLHCFDFGQDLEQGQQIVPALRLGVDFPFFFLAGLVCCWRE